MEWLGRSILGQDKGETGIVYEFITGVYETPLSLIIQAGLDMNWLSPVINDSLEQFYKGYTCNRERVDGKATAIIQSTTEKETRYLFEKNNI